MSQCIRGSVAAAALRSAASLQRVSVHHHSLHAPCTHPSSAPLNLPHYHNDFYYYTSLETFALGTRLAPSAFATASDAMTAPSLEMKFSCLRTHTHTHTHTRPFNSLFPGKPVVHAQFSTSESDNDESSVTVKNISAFYT